MLQNYPTAAEYASTSSHNIYHYILSDSTITVTSTDATNYGYNYLGANLYQVYWMSIDYDGEDSGDLLYTKNFTVTNLSGESVTFVINEYDYRSEIWFDPLYAIADTNENITVYFDTYYMVSAGSFVYDGATIVSEPVAVLTEDNHTKYSMVVKINGNKGYLHIQGYDSFSEQFMVDNNFVIIPIPVENFPCWKDTELSIATDSDYVSYTFTNTETDTDFFTGRAYAIDGYATIPVNNIIQSYLSSSFDPSTAAQGVWIKDTDAYLVFKVTSEGKNLMKYFTWLDYSYDDRNVEDTVFINDYVRLSSPSNGYTVFSVVNTKGSNEATIEEDCGTLIWDDMVNDGEYGVYHLVLKDADEENYTCYEYRTSGTTERFTLAIANSCHRYELIYKNLYGGYDTFTFLGNDKATDSWTNYSIEKTFSNTKADFRTKHYLKDVTTKVALYTGWLNDAESLRMDNLLESTRVYLYDMQDDTMVPVVITDTSWEKKTYSNQGKKLVAYTVNVEYSQNKIRR